MGALEDDVRELVLGRYSSLARFAREIDIPEHTLYSALSKGLQKTTLSTIVPICTGLGLDPIEIASGRLAFTANKPRPVFVPLYGSIAAGIPIDMQEADDSFPIPGELHAAFRNAFMLRVEGNSMNRMLPNGSLVLIDPCSTIEVSRQIYAVAIDSQPATVKRVILHDNGLTLQPDSDDPTYKPQLLDYSMADTPEVSTIGRVVWWCSPFERYA